MRKLILLFLSSLLILSVSTGALLWSMYDLLLDFDFVKQEIEKYDVFTLAESSLADLLEQEQQELLSSQNPLYFSRHELEDLLNDAVPPSWLQEQTGEILDEFQDWLASDEKYFNPSIDLSKQKETFFETFETALKHKEQQIPVCTQDQLIQLQHADYSTLKCLPSGVSMEDLLGSGGYTFLEDFASVVPDHLSLREIFANEFIDQEPADQNNQAQQPEDELSRYNSNYEDFMSGLRQIRDILTMVEQAFVIWLIANFVLLALIVLFTKKSILTLLRWLGFTFVSIGLNFLVFLFLGHWGSKLVQEQIKTALPKDLQTEYLDILLNLLQDIIARLNSFYILLTLIFLGAGVSFYLGLWFIKKKRYL